MHPNHKNLKSSILIGLCNNINDWSHLQEARFMIAIRKLKEWNTRLPHENSGEAQLIK